MKPADDFLLMLWGVGGGLLMFFLSAVFYPALGIPPLWLVGLPVSTMFFVLCRVTFWDEP